MCVCVCVFVRVYIYIYVCVCGYIYICVCVCIFFLSFPGIVTETKESFLKSLRRDFPRELVPVVLAPLLYPSKLDLPMDKVNQDSSTMTNTMVSTRKWEQYQGTEFHHTVTWYNRLQFQGTQSYCTVQAGTVGCSSKSLRLTALLQQVR